MRRLWKSGSSVGMWKSVWRHRLQPMAGELADHTPAIGQWGGGLQLWRSFDAHRGAREQTGPQSPVNTIIKPQSISLNGAYSRAVGDLAVCLYECICNCNMYSSVSLRLRCILGVPSRLGRARAGRVRGTGGVTSQPGPDAWSDISGPGWFPAVGYPHSLTRSRGEESSEAPITQD